MFINEIKNFLWANEEQKLCQHHQQQGEPPSTAKTCTIVMVIVSLTLYTVFRVLSTYETFKTTMYVYIQFELVLAANVT